MIETDRLLLRPPTLEDADAVYRMRSDPELMRFIGGKALSREEAWQRLLRSAGHWSLLGYGFFMVVERAGGHVIGEAGLMESRRGLGELFDPFPEAGWVFAGEATGRGYATEAARAAHDWFSSRSPARRTVCIIDPANAASLHVAAKLGYQSFGTVSYRKSTITMLERLAGE